MVAQDGQDKITLEMFAGPTDASETGRGVEKASFHIYGTGAVMSFHPSWQHLFSKPVTAVIKRKT